MNVLILSAGTRNKLVRYFRTALAGKGAVIAADSSPYAPALYEADRYYLLPRADAAGYFRAVEEVCRKERVAGLLSLIDPEIVVLARRTSDLDDIGVKVIGSAHPLCELALDKYRMYQWLTDHGYHGVRTWDDPAAFLQTVADGKAEFPVIIKPKCGSASVGIRKAHNKEMLTQYCREAHDVIVQEYLIGQEIGADVYVDMLSGEVVSIFTKKKIRMRAGETDKSASFKDERLFLLIERFVTEAGFRGPIDIDLFEIDGQYYISEVNPRFGGGYPHAHECGCDFTKLILNNLNGVANEPRIGDYEEGVCMMKYSDVTILRESELAK